MIEEASFLNSLKDSREFYCEDCETMFEDDIWLIIDVQERPDLLEKIQDDWVPVGECPDCGVKNFSAPLFLYLPGDVPPTLLATQKMEQVFLSDKLEVITLMERLQETSQDETIKENFYEPGNWVEKVNLAEKLEDYPEVTLQDQQLKSYQNLRKIQEEHPREFLFSAIEAYLGAGSFPAKAKVVGMAPELLTEDIDEFFEMLIEHAKNKEDDWRLRIYQAQWDFLKRAREIGFVEALEEHITREEEYKLEEL